MSAPIPQPGGFDLPTIATVSIALARVEQELDAIGVKYVAALAAFNLAEELRLKSTAELASARTELKHLRENEEIRARVIRERNTELSRAFEYAKSLAELACPDPAAHTTTEGAPMENITDGGEGGNRADGLTGGSGA